MDAASISEHPAFSAPWYYRLELAPDLFTDGRPRPSLDAVRHLLAGVEFEAAPEGGRRCLDIGCMEGLLSILMTRRGGEVLAYDRELRADRLHLVQKALDLEFEMIGNFPLKDLNSQLRSRDIGPFDFVAFSGVLYHMFDPVAGVFAVRGAVRDGGLVLIETSASNDPEPLITFPGDGIGGPSATLLPSVEGLARMASLAALEPLCVLSAPGAVPRGEGRRGRRRSGRVAMICRALPRESVAGDPFERDRAEFMDWETVRSDAPPLGFTPPDIDEEIAETPLGKTIVRPNSPERGILRLGEDR